jgi:exonuclease SbcC
VFGALDENRRQHVLDLFRGLQTRFEQVVLITHIETIRDGCDHVLSVRYDPGSGASVVHAAPVTVDADLVGADA